MRRKRFIKETSVCLACLMAASMIALAGCGRLSRENSLVATNDFGSSGYTAGYAAAEPSSRSFKLDAGATKASASMDVYDSNISVGGGRATSSVSGNDIASQVKSTMMIVRNASISLDVKSLDTFTDNLNDKVMQFDGYFENTNVNNYASEWSTERYGYYTVRIPSEKLDDFLNYTDSEGSITNKQISTEDVSLEYIDVEAHISSLESERNHLRELLDRAENVTEIMEVEDKLSDVQSRLDSYVNQKRSLENRASYSTVSINARESREVEHPIAYVFDINVHEHLVEGLEAAVELFVMLLSAVPVIAIVTLFTLLFIWIVRKIWGAIFRRKDRKDALSKDTEKFIRDLAILTECAKASVKAEQEQNEVQDAMKENAPEKPEETALPEILYPSEKKEDNSENV